MSILGALKLVLNYDVNIFEDGPARNLTTGRGINEDVIGLLHVQKTLETKVSGLLSRAG